ncbi:hypothetical protein [Halapricum hydrolyticum]|uniref:Uncharacterized protein n=1 Tax=Halapricum hydrolyticum TaxID=2979991 RepID=A0AAE3I8D8_9EURY|nr:hypothetical protein [Halapricum hydrolyticum]MCU4716865.1 hypothetical protein [Halapricum hydrolyticum]MCU4725530.1 hypothetical protein [Halapricum hydrolyticum]
MSKQLSNIASEATERTNTTGVMTPILELQPDDGLMWVIKNAVERGQQAQGIPIYADLKDGSGNDLPADTRMAIQFESPNDDDAQTVSEPKTNIRAYRTLSIQDQQNEEYIDQVKHILKGSQLRVDDVDKMYISVDSSVQVDWSQGTRVTIAESAVKEV